MLAHGPAIDGLTTHQNIRPTGSIADLKNVGGLFE
jgi:hypothetical protein